MGVQNLSYSPRLDGRLAKVRERLRGLQHDLAGMVLEVDEVQDRLSKVGRPSILLRPDVRGKWLAMRPDFLAGRLTKTQAAKSLGISRPSLDRLLAIAGAPSSSPEYDQGTVDTGVSLTEA